ncbi:MAG: prephenate dehydratase, partial [Pseudonocardia sp.]|nr:prephenate dehydratase [Pseudonocardia sp.]
GHVARPDMGEALAALHRRCLRVRYLGSYQRGCEPDGGRRTPAARTARNGEGRFAAAAAWLDGVRAGTLA